LIAQPDETPSDELLAQNAPQDPQAFAELYRRYYERIYRYHLARLGDRLDAQDMTARTFLAAFERLPGSRLTGSFAGWLFGVARHKLADHYRSNRPHLPLEDAANLPDGNALPEQAVAARLDIQRVAAALAALAPERADALALRFFAGLSAAEIARLLDKTEAAVKMLVHRGLQDLQARLNAPELED
jgi:RNA polymerase sigma-70 factor (ECF subfamily)